MIIRFTLGERVVDFDNSTLLASEAIQLQRVTGRMIADLDRSLYQGDAEATTAVYWLACRRAGDDVAYRDFDYDFKRMRVEIVDGAAAPAPGDSAGEAGEPDPTHAAAAPPTT